MFDHDEVGYNYRLPNINAALACAQLERLDSILAKKRALAMHYQKLCADLGYHFMAEPTGTASNYWLNTLQLPDEASRDSLLETANAQGVQVRPTWTLMSKLPMYQGCFAMPTPVAHTLAATLVNIPSSMNHALKG